MKHVVFHIILLLALVSCRPKPIDIDVESAPPKLVAFTHIIPNTVMIVGISKSFSVLEGNSEEDFDSLLISGATVQVKFDNKVFDFFELSPGIYASFSEAYQVNQEYELIVYADGDTISSKTKMLPKVDFTQVTPLVEKLATDTSIYINLAFDDIPDTPNWYLINIYRKQEDFTGADNVNYFLNGSNVLARSILVSDKEFAGTYQNNLLLNELHHKDSIVVTLSNINESYYKYLSFKVGGGNVLNQLNIEPVNYPTNIVNGYGFFNTHFPDIRFFDLGQF
jgi:hypothetical protein